ncbi:MAG: hypothetical protein K1X94_02390 [Sandaracinaceae bacterium]|nr:hypothetical protein [Sandaracinaceae bacterium]
MTRSSEQTRGAGFRARASRRFGALAFALAVGACVAPPRERVEMGPDTPYPTCPEEDAAVTTLAEGELRAGPVMRESSVVETFSLIRRGCHIVFTGVLDWDLGATDVEVVYDQELRPIRAWKRGTSPGPLEARRRTDIRSYDFRGERLMMRRRGGLDELELWRFRQAPPPVVIGPGRGLISVWLRRAHLAVGGRVREAAVDIREPIEVIRDVTLTRYEDRDDPEMGHVRVYTIYGREPIFADDNDVVVGDMAGMRPAALVHTPMPSPVPREGPADPRGTP